MRKRIIAFYDVLIFGIICGPMIIASTFLLFLLVIKGTHKWIDDNWYLVLIFAVTFVLPLGGIRIFRYCVITTNSLHFHYFPFTNSWNNASNNIDIRWNQDVFILEVKSIEIVKLTLEEKRTKVFYKHLFNKYLKIGLKYGAYKYIYVGNYSNYQIRKIIQIVSEK